MLTPAPWRSVGCAAMLLVVTLIAGPLYSAKGQPDALCAAHQLVAPLVCYARPPSRFRSRTFLRNSLITSLLYWWFTLGVLSAFGECSVPGRTACFW